MDYDPILVEFLKKMRACENNGDCEAAHYEADVLLVDLIRHLKTDTDQQPLLEDILESYGTVSKWYA